jgi:xyloglucan-specific exo-beta-1,4-glucanase
MKCDARAVFAALALVLASCQGSGFDNGMGGMGGDMSPPVTQPGQIGGMSGGGLGGMNGQMAGPSIGPNGKEELSNPGATLAPNVAQYPIGQGPSGMKCPTVTQLNSQYACTLAFNIPASPAPGTSAKPTASPTPSPKPSASSDDDSDTSDESDDSASPSPTPLGTMTLQIEPLPRDIPAMSNPNPLFMHVTPLVAIRLQSNTDFQLNGAASVQYTLPSTQFSGRVFALQLYNESVVRGKRTEQLLASYPKFTTPQSQTVGFSFSVPKVTVRHTQIWLLAMYGAQLPPGTTPTPSPSPSPSGSPSSSP